MQTGNGHNPAERQESQLIPHPQTGEPIFMEAAPPAPRRRVTTPVILFLLTLLSTLAVGAQFTLAYNNNQGVSFDHSPYYAIIMQPSLILLGVPFAFTLLGILMAHELGHYFACRYYRIHATLPYFIPAPTLIGTLGAFIRIRSPIVNRKALFDVGISGPVVGFIFAVPALAIAIAASKVVPASQVESVLTFGNPPLAAMLIALLRPEVAPQDILLHPVGRAAWVGLFATALNLIPAGQLDGGHILYALASEKHRRVSVMVAFALIAMGTLSIFARVFWEGWLMWGLLLLVFGFRHPMLLDRWEALDRGRRVWALVALAIFLLCFTPAPFVIRR